MRGAFVNTLVGLAEKDERIVLLTGDLGFMALEPFAERFPKRFFNVGVAEQNMIGLSTGLAEAGFIPFVYSIVTFATLRSYEFVRNGPILHKLPVRIVGIGGGFEYGYNGITHYGLEDIGIMRIQPGMTVVAPADYKQARNVLLKTWNLPGPVYYRIGKDDKTEIYGLEGKFELGRVQLIDNGTDVLIISMGSITFEANKAREALAKQGISSTLMVLAILNPAPFADLVRVLSRFRLVVTVEAHYITGGLGSLVSEVIADRGLNCQLIRCGVKGSPDCISGSQSFLNCKHGLSHEILTEILLKSLSNNKVKRWMNI